MRIVEYRVPARLLPFFKKRKRELHVDGHFESVHDEGVVGSAGQVEWLKELLETDAVQEPS